ncbi:MAG: hypothetical protein ACFFD4_01860 [Candidatus Odinarchaeota archaeon]
MAGLPVVVYLLYKLIFNPDRKFEMELISADVKELTKQMAIVNEKLVEMDDKIKQLEEKMPPRT